MTDKANVLDFSTLIQSEVEEGRLFFNQRRAVIFDTETMGTLRQQLIETLGQELAMGLLIRFGYTQGHNDAKKLEESFDWETETDWLAAGPIINSMTGLVHVTPEKIEFDRETGHFYMQGIWHNSYEAEEHLNRYGPSDHPVCWSLIGYISGYTSAFFGQELVAIETECVGQGSDRCHWEVRPVAEWGADPRVASYLDALESMDLGDLLTRNNQRLQESEARFRDLTFSSTDWIWETDADGHYTYCSGRVEDILGYTVEEILGKTPFDLMPQDKAASANEILSQIRAQKQPITNLESLVTAKDGRAVCLLTNGVPRFDEQGNLIGYRGVSKDITESKSAGEILQETQRLLQDILDNTKAAIYVKDLEGRYMLINRQYTSLFNIEREEIVGKSTHDVFPKKLADEYWQSDLEVIRSGIPQERLENTLLQDKESGTQMERTYLSHKFLVYDDSGTPYAVCGIGTDVTAREITTEEQREVLLTELENQARQLQTALDKTEMLYQSSARIVHAASADEILQTLVESTPLEHFDRANIFFFDRPWEDKIQPDTMTVTARWERAASPTDTESHAPIGTRYSLDEYPLMDIISSDEPIYLRDVSTDERISDTLRTLLVDEMGIQSLTFWPLVISGQWLGFLIGESSIVQEIDENEIRQAASLIGQAAAALQSQRLFARAQARIERERLVRTITDRIRRGTDRNIILRTALQELSQMLGASESIVHLGTQEQLRSKYSDSIKG
jgi:PAS domain S-box-containing protein